MNQFFNFKAIKLLLVCLSFFISSVFAQYTEDAVIVESIPFTSFVSDNTDVFTNDEEAELLKQIETIKENTTLEFAVCSVESIGHKSLHQVATTALDVWGIGKDRKNGVLFLLVTGERKVYIATGVGLRKYLKDDQVRLTLEMKVVPKLRDGDYFQGVQVGMNAILEDLEGSPIAKRPNFFSFKRIFKVVPLVFVCITIFLVLMILKKSRRNQV